jgi:nitrite reductase/ring-hydroxylating ferredoxin subunit
MENAVEETLASVGPGTPSGEVFRRYWLPVEVAANLGGRRGEFLGTRNPLRIRVLGENLVLFRDGSGKPALVAEHCAHRGTSLYYGRVEQSGIRCLYHGWTFDREGNCIDTPAEPPSSNFKNSIRQPAYPCMEVAGLIFAYMGPEDLQPPFPRYPQLFREDGIRITGNGGRIQKSNVFLQTLDNVLDPWHAEIGHGWFKDPPVVGRMHHGGELKQPTPVKYERTPWGACYVRLTDTERPGVYEYHETHAVLPCQRCQRPNAGTIIWAVPIDDFTTRWLGVSFYPFDKDGNVPQEAYQAINSQGLSDMKADYTEGWVEEVGHWWNHGHRWRGGPIWEDEVFMGTQGDAERGFLPDWDKWHLASSDRGVALMHRLWKEQVDRVKEGLDPIGIIREPANEMFIPVTADVRLLNWEDGMARFSMTVEERTREREADLAEAGRLR